MTAKKPQTGAARQRVEQPEARTAGTFEQESNPAPANLLGVADPRPLTERTIANLQRTAGNRAVERLLARTAQPQAPASGSPAAKPNATGMPDSLKSGIENLSGMAVDDVRVHYNSARPDQIQSFAYTQGTDIYLGPGQESYLPHEAWHAVQQKQGRVAATVQAKGMPMNNASSLEAEADRMGAQAAEGWAPPAAAPPTVSRTRDTLILRDRSLAPGGGPVIQAASYHLKDGSTIYADVTEAAGKISIEGERTTGPQSTEKISGEVTFKTLQVPKAAVSSAWLTFGSVNALSISVINAAPRGLRVGDLLMYHLSQYAKAQSIDYIIAGDVTAAREAYYEPLGFVDFLNAPKWADLKAQKEKIEEKIIAEAATMDPLELEALIREKTKFVNQMAENKIFMTTAALADVTLSKWSARWSRI